ncbi:hypothetical protein VZ95_16560 [Elstera litoralis]|uniref:HTH luxR-type domain-containing protein n=1 Tax=Elstera litoralis TaxID=552518 RepID=A0A0F3IPI0_9PROT|nr:LuxR C-terminal-related transcriptional regulator [Elstera litoralis]KJV08630.1 hypothetical protein VZ95_16560 [Elstera litoralis]
MLTLSPKNGPDAPARIAALERALAECQQDLKVARALLSDHLARASGGFPQALPMHLTARQRQVMTLVLAGHPSKNIARDIGISQRTVENHRAAIMRKTGATSIPALVRLALDAGWEDKKIQ